MKYFTNYEDSSNEELNLAPILATLLRFLLFHENRSLI
jgi:hypothetical protein